MEALALLAVIVDLTNFVILYSVQLDDHHDIFIVVVDEVYPTNIHLNGRQPTLHTHENLTRQA